VAVAAAKALAECFKQASYQITEKLEDEMDLCICLSGDGTLLSTIRNLNDRRWQIPILPVHGSHGLGFLHSLSMPAETENFPKWAERVVDFVSKEKYKFLNRWGLVAKLYAANGSLMKESIWALNDLVIAKGALSRMVRLSVEVNGTSLIEKTRGDGLIISSAVGSTGYSMSAGGPVMDSSLRSLLVTPVCLHHMSIRPLVLHYSNTIRIKILESSNSCYLTCDGQEGFKLESGQSVELCSAPHTLKWMMPDETMVERNFFKLLGGKLGYGGN